MANITEDYVSYETAKLLKEKGFDENTPVNYFVGDDKLRGCVVGEMIYHKRAEEDTHLIACPTLQMAMKWLREEKDVQIEISIVGTDTWESPTKWMYGFRCQTKEVIDRRNADFSSYEEACEAAINYCLENLI